MKELFISFPLSEKCLAITTTTELGNMAYQVDNGNEVLTHRLELANALNIPIGNFTYVHQHHSDLIEKVSYEQIGKGKNAFEDGLECDALYTFFKGTPLCIFHADCVPIFFIDETKDLVGIIHAGFKGTLKHVAYKTIKKIIEEENVDVRNLKFYIGPYRMPESFEIDLATRKEIETARLDEAIIDNRFDNGLANKLDLYKLGVKDSQIRCCNFDTVKDDRFFSAHQKTPVGRMVSLIVLK
jgi:YfiH family protein